MTEPTKRHTATVVVPMPPSLRERIEDEAFSLRITRAEVVRRAVVAFLPAETKSEASE